MEYLSISSTAFSIANSFRSDLIDWRHLLFSLIESQKFVKLQKKKKEKMMEKQIDTNARMEFSRIPIIYSSSYRYELNAVTYI